MKKISAVVLLVAVLMCFGYSFAAMGQQLFVSTTGLDTNDGTEAYPFKTIGRAKQEVAAINDDMSSDIIVNILPGCYKLDDTEIFGVAHSGTNGYDVIFRGSNPQSPPVISGGTEITGWTLWGNGIWRASVTANEIRNLYINGFPAMRARSESTYLAVAGYCDTDLEYELDGLVVFPFPDTNFAHPEEMELVWELAWCNQRTPLEDIIEEDGLTVMLMKQPCFSMQITVLAIDPGVGKRFYIENAMEFLDEPGEFYYNKTEGKIYYYPYAEENLNSSETYANDTEFLFKVAGESPENKVSHIIFDNLNIRYGAWHGVTRNGLVGYQADMIVDTENGTSDLLMVPAQFAVEKADNIVIENCRFSCLGSAAVSMVDAVSNSTIQNNVFKDISGTGVIIGTWEHETSMPSGMERCTNIDVTNNVFRRIAGEYRACTAISVYYENSINILHNDIKETPYTGITAGWGWGSGGAEGCEDINISYNRIDDIMCTLSDGGGIYTLGALPDSTISYNYLRVLNYRYYPYNCRGLYNDAGSSYLYEHSNVIDVGTQGYWGVGTVSVHDMLVDGNYVSSNYSNYSGTNVTVQNTSVVTGAWPSAAQNIIDVAGVTDTGLLDDVERPAWRDSIIKTIPRDPFYVLIGNWEFSDGIGSDTAADGSPYSDNDGTLENMNLQNCWVTGTEINGFALYFDGSDDYVNLGDIDAANGLTEITVSLWVHSSNFSQNGMLIIKNPLNSVWQLYFETNSLRWRGGGWNNGTLIVNSLPSNDAWHHIAVVQAGTTATMYVDGQVAASGTVNALGSSSGSVNIGRYDNGYYFNGTIDEVRLYNCALGANEITNLSSRGPVGKWTFNDGTGSTAVDSSTTGNDGTLKNMNLASCWVDGISDSALHFDGTEDYVDMPWSSAMPLNAPFTISAWIRTDVQQNSWGSEGWILNLYKNTSNNVGAAIFAGGYFNQPNNRNAISFEWCRTDMSPRILSYDTSNSPAAYWDGNWHLITATHDGTTAKLYYDGTEVATYNDACGYDFGIGAKVGSYNGKQRFFEGDIDEVRVYNYALGAGRVMELFADDTVLIGNWEFNDGTGGTAVDSSQDSGNDGTLENMDWGSCWVSGVTDSALYFDGSDDYVDLGDIDAADGLTDMTVSLWAYSSNFAHNGMLIMKNPLNSVWQLYFETTSLRWRGGGWNNGTLVVNSLPSNNEWHHIAVVQSGTIATMYIDGQVAASGSVNALGSSSGSVNIGRYDNGYYFNGIIDEVRVYKYALGTSEITKLFTKVPVGYWKFNDGTGSDIAVNSSLCEDYDGTLENMNSANCWVSGVSDSALYFDGDGDYVDIAELGQGDIAWNTDEWSVSVWVNFNSAGTKETVIGWGDGNTSPYYLWMINKYTDDVLEVNTYDGSNDRLVSTYDFTGEIGNWHHVAFTHKADTTCEIYVDGVSRGSTTLGIGSRTDTPDKVRMGDRIWSYRGGDFNGTIDEVRVYKHVLSTYEVMSLYEEFTP